MFAKPTNLAIELPLAAIADFCRRWSILRLDVFGSALRRDFNANSDIDLVATYADDAHWSLLDRVHMKHELEDLVGREIDLLNRRALEKQPQSSRAQSILKESRVLYAES
jgi:predicted nucleotidyltransferase